MREKKENARYERERMRYAWFIFRSCARLLFTHGTHSKQTQAKMGKQIGSEVIICFPSIRLDSLRHAVGGAYVRDMADDCWACETHPSWQMYEQFNYNNGSISILCV